MADEQKPEVPEFAQPLIDYLEMQWHPDPARHPEQAQKLMALRRALALPDPPEETAPVDETIDDLAANSGEANNQEGE